MKEEWCNATLRFPILKHAKHMCPVLWRAKFQILSIIILPTALRLRQRMPIVVSVFEPELVFRAELSSAARESLSAINHAATMGEQFLYACISKTLESGTPHQAASILLGLLTKYDFEPPKHISLPTLLR
jgi:hypothetical protein